MTLTFTDFFKKKVKSYDFRNKSASKKNSKCWFLPNLEKILKKVTDKFKSLNDFFYENGQIKMPTNSLNKKKDFPKTSQASFKRHVPETEWETKYLKIFLRKFYIKLSSPWRVAKY